MRPAMSDHKISVSFDFGGIFDDFLNFLFPEKKTNHIKLETYSLFEKEFIDITTYQFSSFITR